MHSEEKSKQCEHCDFTSIQAENLRKHLKTHSGEKSNKCDITSFQADNLMRHLKTHSGEKSNKGDQCDFVQTKLAIWGGIWIRIVMKNQRRATCATLHQSKLTISALTRLLHCKTSRLINYLYWCKVMQIFFCRLPISLGDPIWGTIWKRTV